MKDTAEAIHYTLYIHPQQSNPGKFWISVNWYVLVLSYTRLIGDMAMLLLSIITVWNITNILYHEVADQFYFFLYVF